MEGELEQHMTRKKRRRYRSCISVPIVRGMSQLVCTGANQRQRCTAGIDLVTVDRIKTRTTCLSITKMGCSKSKTGAPRLRIVDEFPGEAA
jgi:hypothetical protein